MDTVTVDDLAVGFRSANAGDEAIVFKSWLLGHRKGGDWPPRLASRRYFEEHKATIARLLADGYALIACNAERPAHVLGFAVHAAPAVLHWIYVKQAMRGAGIGRHLLKRAGLWGRPVICSHWSRAASRLRHEHGYPWIYEPFALETSNARMDQSPDEGRAARGGAATHSTR